MLMVKFETLMIRPFNDIFLCSGCPGKSFFFLIICNTFIGFTLLKQLLTVVLTALRVPSRLYWLAKGKVDTYLGKNTIFPEHPVPVFLGL